MSKTATNPKRRVSQAPIKVGKCHAGCGADIEYRTNPRVVCDACKAGRLRERSRLGMERQRRKLGVPLVKGTVIICEACGARVVLNRRTIARYCPACYLSENGAVARQRAEKKRQTLEGREYLNTWHRRE